MSCSPNVRVPGTTRTHSCFPELPEVVANQFMVDVEENLYPYVQLEEASSEVDGTTFLTKKKPTGDHSPRDFGSTRRPRQSWHAFRARARSICRKSDRFRVVKSDVQSRWSEL